MTRRRSAKYSGPAAKPSPSATKLFKRSVTPKEVAHTIIEQCWAVGAGHFLTVLNWSAPFDEMAAAHELFGREAIPLLRKG